MVHMILILLLPCMAFARHTSLTTAWNNIPADVVGRSGRIDRSGQKSVSGTIIRVSAEGILLRGKKGDELVERSAIRQITTTTMRRKSGRIAGTTAGAPIGFFAGAFGGFLGTRNSAKIAGAGAAGTVAFASLGYVIGHRLDRDTLTIQVAP